ncbi:MAG: hypothetical protein JWM91_4785 [Rhodospirillales bacterium]|nr:hypothetical protein [Rhodospirillales bacterium]
MLSAIPSEALAGNAVQVSPEGASATDFIGRRKDTSDHPLAFLVNGPPAYVIPPHFHEVDQYQIFVGGSATLGKHDVLPGSIHYADAYTPYGPIMATEEGFNYLTLRPKSISGYHEMPEGGPLLKPVNEARGRRGRMMVADIAPAQPRETAREALFEEKDGIAAYRLSAAPGATLPQPDIAHGGAYFVVLEGEITVAGQSYPSRSCIWVDQDEAAPEMTAGPDGATVAFTSFARHA